MLQLYDLFGLIPKAEVKIRVLEPGWYGGTAFPDEVAVSFRRGKRCKGRSGSFLRRLAEGAEQDISQRVEPSPHGYHIRVHDSRVGKVYTELRTAPGKLHREPQHSQFRPGICSKLGEVAGGRTKGAFIYRYVPASQGNHIHDPSVRSHFRNQQAGQKHRPEVIDSKCVLEPIRSQGITLADSSGIIEQGSDRLRPYALCEGTDGVQGCKVERQYAYLGSRQVRKDGIADRFCLPRVAAGHYDRTAGSSHLPCHHGSYRPGGAGYYDPTLHIPSSDCPPITCCRGRL